MSTTVVSDVTEPSAPVVLEIEGQLIVGNRQRFKQRVLDAIAEGATRIVVDLSTCGYVDASGCGVLVSVSKAIRVAGAELVLCGLNEDLRTLFEMTGLTTLFTIAVSRPIALRSFRA